MTSKTRNQLNTLIHPYIFVLKEGQGFKKDYMDYSLMMVFVHPQFLKSKPGVKSSVLPQVFQTNFAQNRIGSLGTASKTTNKETTL